MLDTVTLFKEDVRPVSEIREAANVAFVQADVKWPATLVQIRHLLGHVVHLLHHHQGRLSLRITPQNLHIILYRRIMV
jgi:hypothetical protein